MTVVTTIHTAGLSKRYGETPAFDRLDLDVEQGESFRAGAAGLMIAIGVVASVAAIGAFRRRDLLGA